MTRLFSGPISFPAGANETAALPIPAGIKQSGVPLTVNVSMDADPFPAGTTTILILLSLDGGLTYPRSGGGSFINPHNFGRFAHVWPLGFSLGPDDSPTHAKVSTDAPAAFTTATTIDAV